MSSRQLAKSCIICTFCGCGGKGGERMGREERPGRWGEERHTDRGSEIRTDEKACERQQAGNINTEGEKHKQQEGVRCRQRERGWKSGRKGRMEGRRKGGREDTEPRRESLREKDLVGGCMAQGCMKSPRAR